MLEFCSDTTTKAETGSGGRSLFPSWSREFDSPRSLSKKPVLAGFFIVFVFWGLTNRPSAMKKPIIFKKRGRIWYFRWADELTFHSTGRTTEAARDQFIDVLKEKEFNESGRVKAETLVGVPCRDLVLELRSADASKTSTKGRRALPSAHPVSATSACPGASSNVFANSLELPLACAINRTFEAVGWVLKTRSTSTDARGVTLPRSSLARTRPD